MSKYCSHCGAELIPNARFCTTCGKSIEQVGEQKSEQKIERKVEQNAERKPVEKNRRFPKEGFRWRLFYPLLPAAFILFIGRLS